MLLRTALLTCFVGSFCVSAFAQPARRAAAPAGGGGINLPHSINADDGQQWIVQRGGWLQQQGNMPVFAQAAMLQLNGVAPQGNANRATLDEATGELVIEGLQIGGYPLTRRVFISRDQRYARYIDILRNRQGGDQTITLTLQTSLNFGINGGNVLTDPKRDTVNIGWIAPTGAGPIVAEVFAGRGAPVGPDVNWQPGNSFIQANYRLSIPAGGQVAIMHLHAIVDSEESGEQFAMNLRPSRLLEKVPADIRKAIVNFRVVSSMLGELEVLRGDTLDVVELRTGDQLRGTLQPERFAIITTFGRIELPQERVLGLINTGSFRPRQLLLTVDGEIIGGTLEADSLSIQLSSGQTTRVPLSQVARAGYRKRPGEPEELQPSTAMLTLRSGDRLAVQLPSEPLAVLTRFGAVAVPAERLVTADLRSTETAVHVISLTDGSRFGGLLQANDITLTLQATGQPVTVPMGSIASLQSPPPSEEASDPTDTARARLTLVGDDVLVGALIGELELQTNFDTLRLNAAEIARLAPIENSSADVQVTLWDQTTISGQLRAGSVRCGIAGGAVEAVIPLPLVREYVQPQPRPSQAMVDRIGALVVELGADDFSRRESAEQTLLGMGTVVAPLLTELRGAQSLEAQQRIDSILKKLTSR